MNRLCLVALVGLPAVGKTTLCKYLMESEALTFNIFHLCYDNFIQFTSGNPAEYREQRGYLLKCLESLVNSLKTFGNLQTEQLSTTYNQYKNNNSKDTVIFCDDNHYYRSMRYKLFQIARAYNISFCQIFFEKSLQLALELNNLRSGTSKLPQNVLLQMSERFESPNALQHKWEKNTLILKKFDSIRNISSEVVSYISNILNISVEPLALDKSESFAQQSLVHELDVLIRKRISTLIRSSTTAEKNLLAKQLNDKRKEILKELQFKLNDEQKDNINLNKYVDLLNCEQIILF